MKCPVLLVLCGLCGVPAGVRAEAMPLLGEPDAQGLVVLQLRIQSIEPTYESGFVLTAQAEHQGRPAGIEIEFSAEWRLIPASAEKGVPRDLYVGTAKMRSQGEATANLVGALAEAFGGKPPHARMTEVSLTAVAHGTNPDDWETAPLQFQLIHGDPGRRQEADAADYAEWFCYLDGPQRRLRFHEIDRKYRAILVDLLSRQEALRPAAATPWLLPPMPHDLKPVPDNADFRRFQPPLFPITERQHGIPGEVLVRLDLDADGTIARWRIVRTTSAGFTEAVEKAMRRRNAILHVPAGTYCLSFVFVGPEAGRPDRPGTIWLVSSSFGLRR